MARKKKTDLLQGMLDLLILRSLQGGPLNGWDIMRRIQTVSGDVFRAIPGSLYPALHLLEASGSDWRCATPDHTGTGGRRLKC